MFSSVFFGNYGIHLYFKNKRKQLYKRIGNQKFIQVKNINTEICATNKLSASWQLFYSDIILFDDKLLVILRKKIFNMNQPIIQISKNSHTEKLDGVSRIYLLEKNESLGNKIKIKSSQYLITKTNFEINLDFNEKMDELNIVSEFINNNLK